MMFCLSGRQGTISSGGRRLSLIFQMLGNLSAVIPCPLAVSRDIIDDERYNGHHELKDCQDYGYDYLIHCIYHPFLNRLPAA